MERVPRASFIPAEIVRRLRLDALEEMCPKPTLNQNLDKSPLHTTFSSIVQSFDFSYLGLKMLDSDTASSAKCKNINLIG